MARQRQQEVWIDRAESLELQVYVLSRYIGTASNDFELFRKVLAGERVEVLIQTDRDAQLLLSTPEAAPDDLTIALVDVAPDLEGGLRRRFPQAKIESLRPRGTPEVTP